MEINGHAIGQPQEQLNESTGELVPVPATGLVFGSTEPVAIIERAKLVANQMADIVRKKKLSINISGREFVKIEGWSAVIALLGVFPDAVYCNRVDRKDNEIAYEARVRLRHLSGRLVGDGQGFASSLENKPWGKAEFSIKSMAQTRALGKACRLGFGWIMSLAGYEATSLEELDTVAVEEKTFPGQVKEKKEVTNAK